MKPRPTSLVCAALAALAACGGERAPSPDANGNGQPKPASAAAPVDPDPPSPPAGTLLERAGGVKVEILEAGRGPVARAGRTLRLHHRTRVAQLHAEAAASAPAAQAEPASAPAESAPAAAQEASAHEAAAREADAPAAAPAHEAAAPAGDAHAADGHDPAAAQTELAAAADTHTSGEAPASAPAELFSTFATGIPDEHVLGRGAWIAGLERALEGLRAGTRARATIPFALAYGEAGQGVVPPRADLEIELWIVDVR